MSLEKNKAIIRSWIEAVNKQELNKLNDFIAPNIINHIRQINGREGYIQYITKHFKTFPDFNVTIEDIIAEEDKVWIRIKVTGTYKGEYLGIDSTGKEMKVRGIQIYRIINGKLTEVWTDYNFHLDQLEFFKQLDLIELTEKGKKLFQKEDHNCVISLNFFYFLISK